MATELYKFLRGQLSNLPADHPDRVFLENQREQAKKYLKLQDRQLLNFNDFPDHLLTLKEGPFLTTGDLARVDTDFFLPGARKKIPEEVARIRNDIEGYGNEALSHLCLPIKLAHALQRAQINTIRELRTTLPFSKVAGFIRGIGPKSAAFLKQRLDLFDQELQKFRQKPQ